jgi:hypothetical protein
MNTCVICLDEGKTLLTWHKKNLSTSQDHTSCVDCVAKQIFANRLNCPLCREIIKIKAQKPIHDPESGYTLRHSLNFCVFNIWLKIIGKEIIAFPISLLFSSPIFQNVVYWLEYSPYSQHHTDYTFDSIRDVIRTHMIIGNQNHIINSVTNWLELKNTVGLVMLVSMAFFNVMDMMAFSNLRSSLEGTVEQMVHLGIALTISVIFRNSVSDFFNSESYSLELTVAPSLNQRRILNSSLEYLSIFILSLTVLSFKINQIIKNHMYLFSENSMIEKLKSGDIKLVGTKTYPA